MHQSLTGYGPDAAIFDNGLKTAIAAGSSSRSNDGEVARATPWVIVNQVDDARRSFERLQLVTLRFLGHDLRLLGEIPRSQEVLDSIKSFLPVVKADTDCPASRVFHSIARKLDDELARLSISRGPTEPQSEEKAELPDLSTPLSQSA
jgi:MinD-like ATPase involved in chromosome partitioning or flagellar assembly